MTATCLVGEADPFLARLLERFGEASGLTMVRAKAARTSCSWRAPLRPGSDHRGRGAHGHPARLGSATGGQIRASAGAHPGDHVLMADGS